MEQIASQNLVIEFANSILLFVSWKLVIVYVFVFLRPHVLHLFYPSYCSHTHFSHTRPPLSRSPPSSPTLFNLSQSPLSSPTLSPHYSRTPPPSLSPHSLFTQPEFMFALAQTLANTSNNAVVRQAAGVYLKNCLFSKEENAKLQFRERWLLIDASARDQIKDLVH